MFSHIYISGSGSVLEIEGGKVYGKQCTRVIYLYSLFTLSISICIYLDLSVFIWISKLKVVKFMANIARVWLLYFISIKDNNEGLIWWRKMFSHIYSRLNE